MMNTEYTVNRKPNLTCFL